MDMEALKQKALACQECGLRNQAKQVVFGEGNPQAGLMLVGEGPGAREDELGRPFVGAAGQLLDRILAAAGFKREEVYITNVVKCRPRNIPLENGRYRGGSTNRPPTPAEIKACFYWLEEQIALIKPRIIVCLGAHATQALIAPEARITRLRGQWIEKGGIRYLPTYHPAALLRDPGKKRPVWEDFQKIRDAYQAAITEQLSFF